MRRTNSPLYKRLMRSGVNPHDEFDKFIVGNIQVQATELVSKINSMIDGNSPSQVKVILGNNGNGKTILNYFLQQAATNRNIKIDNGVVEGNVSFDVLFSRVVLNSAVSSDYGIELAKNMQRSIYEEPIHTYGSIATRIISEYLDSERASLVNLPMMFLKYGANKLIKEYEDSIKDLVTTDEIEPVIHALEKTYQKLYKKYSSHRLSNKFATYCAQKRISNLLMNHFGGKAPLSTRELNTNLYNDLGANHAAGQSLETIKAIHEIASSVKCKLLILAIDDCNPTKPPISLLPLLDTLGEFTSPKILLVITGIKDVWDEYKLDEMTDKSMYQKLIKFGAPLYVNNPNKHDLLLLLEKLITLSNSETMDEGVCVSISNSEKDALILECISDQNPKTSFRESTIFILNKLEEIRSKVNN